MALGSSAKTHAKRAKSHAAWAKTLASQASKAASKGNCAVAVRALTGAALHAGMRTAEQLGTVKRRRKALVGKEFSRAFKGWSKTYAKVVAQCAHKK